LAPERLKVQLVIHDKSSTHRCLRERERSAILPSSHINFLPANGHST
jgi:hypothetical protein